jgi:hypothetical protein
MPIVGTVKSTNSIVDDPASSGEFPESDEFKQILDAEQDGRPEGCDKIHGYDEAFAISVSRTKNEESR